MSDQPKIAQLTPAHKQFSLLFELLQITSRHPASIHCRIVDDTAIANACFTQYSHKLEAGVVYHMTNLKCKVVNSHLEIHMTPSTSVTKEPHCLNFRDKSNDISTKFYATKQEIQAVTKGNSIYNQHSVTLTPSLTISSLNTPTNSLIPLTKQEATEQIRLKREFDFKMKNYQKQEQVKFNKDDQTKNVNKKAKSIQTAPARLDARQGKEQKLKYKEKVVEAAKSGKVIRYAEKPQKTEDRLKNEPEQKDKYTKGEHTTNGKHRGTEGEQRRTEGEQRRTEGEQKGTTIKGEHKSPETKEKTNKSNSVIYKAKASEGLPLLRSGSKNEQQEYQRPKFVEKKENCGECMELISVVAHVGAHVNLKVWICMNRRNENEGGYDVMIADKTGSVWLAVGRVQLEGGQWYQIDNLEVVREEGRLLLKETEYMFSQARQLDEAAPFSLKPISGR